MANPITKFTILAAGSLFSFVAAAQFDSLPPKNDGMDTNGIFRRHPETVGGFRTRIESLSPEQKENMRRRIIENRQRRSEAFPPPDKLEKEKIRQQLMEHRMEQSEHRGAFREKINNLSPDEKRALLESLRDRKSLNKEEKRLRRQ